MAVQASSEGGGASFERFTDGVTVTHPIHKATHGYKLEVYDGHAHVFPLYEEAMEGRPTSDPIRTAARSDGIAFYNARRQEKDGVTNVALWWERLLRHVVT